MKKRATALIWIIILAAILASFGSRAIVRFSGLETKPVREWTIAETNREYPIIAMGSSFTFFGIDFKNLAHETGSPVVCRSAASASPSELEHIIPDLPNPKLTIIGVSVYDLNEQILGDFRADIVPIRQAISDLHSCGADWYFVKKVVGQYPVCYIRKVFPAAGRSTAVMSALRDQAINLMKRAKGEPVPQHLSVDTHYTTPHPESLENWAPSRLVTAIAALNVASNGKQEFLGPKHLAFNRMLHKCHGKILVVVLPVSPPYKKEFIGEEVAKSFEASLDLVAKQAPDAEWLRLDRRQEFENKKVFWDTGHMNDDGQKIATSIVLEKIKSSK
jgi:hypothetical protein